MSACHTCKSMGRESGRTAVQDVALGEASDLGAAELGEETDRELGDGVRPFRAACCCR
jgi:hypothetical protein